MTSGRMQFVRRTVAGGFAAGLAAVLAVGMTSATLADTSVVPAMSVSVTSSNSGTTVFDPANFGQSWGNPNGTFGFAGTNSQAGDWSLGWSMLVNPDPFVVANLVVTNNSAVTSLFTLSVTLPIGMPIPFGTFIGGSVTGTVTDLNGNGASLSSPAGGSLYTALLDFAPVATLLDDPFLVSVGAFESGVVGPDSFGEPIPSEIGPAVSDFMTIELSFLLSAGDAASFTSIFVIEPIPAPGAIAVLALAGLVGARRRRRA